MNKLFKPDFGTVPLYAADLPSFLGLNDLGFCLPDRQRQMIACLIRDLLSWTGSAWITSVRNDAVLHNPPVPGAVVCPIEGPEGIVALLVVGPNQSLSPYSPADTRLIHDFCAEIGAILRRSQPCANSDYDERRSAQAIQDRMTPAAWPNVDGIECFGQCERSDKLGGDFFDIARLGSGELVVMSGTLNIEGMIGAILLTGLLTGVQCLCRHKEELALLNAEMNRLLCDIAPENAYASVFSACIDASREQVHYINAGDQAAILLSASGRAQRIESNAAVFGLSRSSVYRVRTAKFSPGDMLIATSDGIAEAESPSGAKFGDWGILQVIRNRRDRGVHDLAGELMTAVRSFTGQRTDITSTDRTVVLAHFADDAHSRPRSIDLRCHPQFHAAATAA
jgi:hypothetical protein